ncbi:tetratricopeptide repeat protein [Amnibacterium sp. CER49]|uniref:tetratricopeptide repeat protein n=1 Tax=Amnibacterium sp. CER49 TaxID=3039161 RepID=UPI0024487224|nr:tetratricopeptide repeat protein [Amnibacterium sp. CER49]MDH2443774.1 tetratricopeptide repeat protein [Amnibacterium sp. CER49]
MSDAVALAERYLELNRPAEAAARIAAHLAQEPEDVRALCMSAIIALRNRDDLGAESAARRAAALAPEFEWPVRLLSIALSRRGRARAAIRAADRAVEMNPSAWEAHANRANVAVTVGRADRRALRAAEQAVRISPDIPDTHNALGWVQARMRRLDEARRTFERSLAINPADDEAKRGLALISIRRLAPWRAWRPSRDELGRNPNAWEAAAVLRLAAHRTIWVAGIATVICARIGYSALDHAVLYGEPSSGTLPAVLLAAVVALVGGWLGLAIARSGGGWRAVRGAVRVHPILRWWALMLAVAVLLMAAPAMLPPAEGRSAYEGAGFLAMAGIWVSLAGMRRERKRATSPRRPA